MKKTITIRIPEPCHEDWNKMTPTEKGKFCGVCTKEVFDFTKATDEELVKKVYNNDKLCGRFKKSQINREMKLERKSGFSLAPLAASFLVPFTLLSSTKTNSESKLQSEFVSLNIGVFNNVPSEKIQITTQGRILDETGKAISNVEISVKETGKSQISGLKGDYLIRSGNDETLVFIKEGFILQEVILGRKNSTLDIVLNAELTKIDSLLVGKIAICQPSITKQKTDSIPQIKQETGKTQIKGTVSDDNGLPLPGVNIIIKETTLGTQSDFDGNYEIEADKNQVLVFSYVGFETEELTLSNINNTINLKMEMSESLAGEIVIITGGISTDYSYKLLGFKKSTYDPEPTSWRKEVQNSLDNEKEFSRIKRQRKKEVKNLKRKNKN